ncbi:MAG: hypothetical protein GEV28_20900 [Actinophytocola sp.]|uniref:hypothetical protein n=1 Tax=Actinophytocola sp. TaxID=1872138 RepID=UPI00132457BC|nr:hypothetical protein [Actinophytocola sp.]MPZ82723.1 hypothetical protein [Actinophytocola sp.]
MTTDGFRVDVVRVRAVSAGLADGRGIVGAALGVVSGATLPDGTFGPATAVLGTGLERLTARRITGLTARLQRLQDLVDNLSRTPSRRSTPSSSGSSAPRTICAPRWTTSSAARRPRSSRSGPTWMWTPQAPWSRAST